MLDINQEILKRLIALRKSNHLTQEQLAENSGISRRYINKLENGHIKKLRFNIVLSYLDACQIDLARFFSDLQKYVNDYEYDWIISQINLPKDNRIRNKVLRGIGMYYASIKAIKTKTQPLSKQAIEKAVIKFGNYRSKIEYIQSVGYEIIAQSGISTIQNPFYRAYINQLCKTIKQNLLNKNTSLSWLEPRHPSYQKVINHWIKKGANSDLLSKIRDAILAYFKLKKREEKTKSRLPVT